MLMVSDFKLAASMLRKICFSHDVYFVDTPISFENDEAGSIFVGDTKNISHTIFKIVSEYINRSKEIVGVQLLEDQNNREDFLLTIANNLRYFIYKDNKFYTELQESHSLRLYQKPVVWILLKDLICPLYDKTIENILVVCGESNKIDISKYYKKGEVEKNGIFNDEPFIFINNIDNLIIQNAFLLISAIEHFGLSPIEVLRDIYQGEIYNIFRGFLVMTMDDDDINDFENILGIIIGVNLFSLQDKYAQTKTQKIAQYGGGINNQWWDIGLIEKMLEPVRGSDWSSFTGIQDYVKEFWDKVEDVRQKRISNGHDNGVPFDVLLRIKSKQTTDLKTDPNVTIQELLSSNRIW